MAKETRKQIVEQTRNEVARHYKAEVARLEERLNKYVEAYAEEARVRQRYQNKVEELQEKVNQYEDWIERLQSFMDMEPDAREKAFTEMKLEKENAEQMKHLLGFYGKYLSIFNI